MDTKDKVLIELYIPSLKEHYDVFIPTGRKVYEVESLLSKMMLLNGYNIVLPGLQHCLAGDVHGSILCFQGLIANTVQQADILRGEKFAYIHFVLPTAQVEQAHDPVAVLLPGKGKDGAKARVRILDLAAVAAAVQGRIFASDGSKLRQQGTVV